MAAGESDVDFLASLADPSGPAIALAPPIVPAVAAGAEDIPEEIASEENAEDSAEVAEPPVVDELARSRKQHIRAVQAANAKWRRYRQVRPESTAK